MNFGKTFAIVEQDLTDVAATAATETRLVSEAEIEFVMRLQAGEAAAFDILINRFSADVYALLFRFTENAEEAKDLTQETFLRVIQAVKDFRGEASLKTWIFRIAINQARNRRRWWKARRQNVTVSLDANQTRNDGDGAAQNLRDTLADNRGASPEAEVLQREQSTQLRQALQELPAQFREAVILRDIKGLSYEEIAQTLDASIGTVKSRIARGRDELRKKLKRSL